MTNSAAAHFGTPPPPRVAVIGAGTMGGAMATRLLESGMEVEVWSRHSESTAGLRRRGATGHAAAAEAVADADVVLTMLPTVDATRSVMFDDGALDVMRPWTTWVQMASIGVTATERLFADTGSRRPDVIFVDAPV